MLAGEIYREEVISVGAYSAVLSDQLGVAKLLLATWGAAPFGWRSRTSPKELALNYRVRGPQDKELQGLEGLSKAEAAERLFTLSRCLVMFFTDQIILTHRLTLVEKLEKAGITESMISDRIPVYMQAVRRLLVDLSH